MTPKPEATDTKECEVQVNSLPAQKKEKIREVTDK
jgi:hypothetical protein